MTAACLPAPHPNPPSTPTDARQPCLSWFMRIKQLSDTHTQIWEFFTTACSITGSSALNPMVCKQVKKGAIYVRAASAYLLSTDPADPTSEVAPRDTVSVKYVNFYRTLTCRIKRPIYIPSCIVFLSSYITNPTRPQRWYFLHIFIHKVNSF